MGNLATDSDLTFPEWLKRSLTELGWTQKQLSQASGVVEPSISELIRGKQALSAETADKLAKVPELKTTADELLKRAGVWNRPVDSSKRAKAVQMFDQLSDPEMELTLDFMIMLRQRDRRQSRRNQ